MSNRFDIICLQEFVFTTCHIYSKVRSKCSLHLTPTKHLPVQYHKCDPDDRFLCVNYGPVSFVSHLTREDFFRRTECFFVFAFLSFLKGEIVVMGDFNAVDDRGDRVRKTGITPSKSTPVNLSVLSWWLGDNGRVESFTALWLRSYLTPPGWIGSDRQHLLLPIYMKISLSTNSLFNKV